MAPVAVPPPPSPKCFNCGGLVDPHKLDSAITAITNRRKSGEQNGGNDNHVQAPGSGSAVVTDYSNKVQILRYIFTADPNCHFDPKLLEESLLKLKPADKATCEACTEHLRKMSEARDAFRMRTANGSVVHQLQNKFTSKSVNTEDAEAPVSDVNKAKWVTGNGMEVPEVVHSSPQPKPDLPARGDVYEDWKQAFNVAQLVMESFKQPGHKKQTIRQINDYILSQEEDFFRKNTERNVVNRILNRFFFNSTQHEYAEGVSGPSGRGSGIQGSAALWTIHRKYSGVGIIWNELRMTHEYAPFQARRQESRPNYRKRECEEPQPMPQPQEEKELSKSKPETVTVTKGNEEREVKVTDPVPAKIRRTDSEDHGPRITPNGESKIVGQKDTWEKVVPKEAETPPEPGKSEEKQGGSRTDKPDKKNKKKGGRCDIKDLQRKLEAIYLIAQRLLSKMQPQAKSSALDDGKLVIDIAESMLFTTKNLYIVLDAFLIPNSDLKRAPLLKTVINFPIEALAEYFRSLLRSEVYLKKVTNSPFVILLDITKLRLLRLLTFQLLALLQDGNLSLEVLGDRYFGYIANRLKWNTDPATRKRVVREDWVEDGLEDALRLWNLILFHLQGLQTQTEATGTTSTSTSTAIDVFAVNLDHQEMGPRGFQEKLDVLNGKLNLKPKPAKTTTNPQSTTIPATPNLNP